MFCFPLGGSTDNRCSIVAMPCRGAPEWAGVRRGEFAKVFHRWCEWVQDGSTSFRDARSMIYVLCLSLCTPTTWSRSQLTKLNDEIYI